MASEIQLSNKKRKSRGGGGGHKSKQMKTKPRGFPGVKGGPKPKIDKQTKRLFQKRARKYNSDSDSDEEEEKEEEKEEKEEDEIDITEKVEESDEEIDVEEDDSDNEDDDDGAVQPGIAKFTEGCNAFKTAFTAITKKNVPEESVLGPVLSGHIKLLAEKLEEDETERRVKGIARKQKQLLSEKGHVKPANFLDAHERFLIGVATKGVVKLFNAVNKAQNAQKGLNPSRFKDAKELGKRKKQAFFTELRKKTSQGTTSTTTDGSDEPAWAPLRDSYMLTNSKLKNWDKMADKTADDDMDNAVSDGSSSD